jgi:hypothetical protein
MPALLINKISWDGWEVYSKNEENDGFFSGQAVMSRRQTAKSA